MRGCGGRFYCSQNAKRADRGWCYRSVQCPQVDVVYAEDLSVRQFTGHELETVLPGSRPEVGFSVANCSAGVHAHAVVARLNSRCRQPRPFFPSLF